MTVVFSIITKDGIVMAADRKISKIENHRLEGIGSKDKIIILDEYKIGVSYWGLATLDNKPIKEHIDKILSQLDGSLIDVDIFSEKCKSYFEQFTPPYLMGLHVAGYVGERPKLRHVFYNNQSKNFINEESNMEFHDQEGSRIPHTQEEEYVQFIALFNGENQIIEKILIKLPQEGGSGLAIDFDKLSVEEAIELAKLLITTTIYIQSFLKIYREIGTTCGNGIDIVTIKRDNIKKVVSNLTSIHINLTPP